MAQRTCMVDGCGIKHSAKGYCNKHYQRWLAGQPVEPGVCYDNSFGPLKQCMKCDRVQTLDGFGRDKTRRDGRYPYCKACTNALRRHERIEYSERYKARHTDYRRKRDADPEQRAKYLARQRDDSLARRYGLTPDELQQMQADQAGKCLICGASDKKLNVDHCHTTGVVRGLLCHLCNVGLGTFSDDRDRMLRAVDYLDGKPLR